MASASLSPEPVTLHYFGVKGAASLATICLEHKSVPYEVKKYGMEDWPAAKPTFPTGMLPVLEYQKDGVKIPESGSISRVCASYAGMLGQGRDFAISEMLMGLNTDVWKQVGGNVPTMMTIGNWDAEKKQKWESENKPKVKELFLKYIQFLQDKADRFTSGGETIGEMEVWLRLYMLQNGAYPELMTDIPQLLPFYTRMSGLKGPTAYAEDKTAFGPMPAYFVPIPN